MCIRRAQGVYQQAGKLHYSGTKSMYMVARLHGDGFISILLCMGKGPSQSAKC